MTGGAHLTFPRTERSPGKNGTARALSPRTRVVTFERPERRVMPARRYVVQKVGDSYVPVLQDSHPRATRAAASIWGGILTLIGLRRGGCTGTALLAGGAWLLYCGATGKGGVCCGGFLNFS